MKYQNIYDSLIERAKSRELVGYVEKHHVVPKCLGGTNAAGNLVALTGREHYVAHMLLAKIHPEHTGLVWAAIRQAKNTRNSRAHEWLRKKWAITIGDARRGAKLPEHHKIALTQSRKGTKNSEEHKRKQSLALKGHVVSDATRRKISAACKGRKGTPMTEENKKRLSERSKGKATFLGKSHTQETRAKMSELRKIFWAKRRAECQA